LIESGIESPSALRALTKRVVHKLRATIESGVVIFAMPITRRDFLNGVALAIAPGLTPAGQLAVAAGRYPPALTGMRGQHPGSFDVAHAFARNGVDFHTDDVAIEERYDLVVVGGGISGLAAAWFYRRAAGSDARILILDNCDDFGGHAKRNEFTTDGRLVIGYGGSQSLQSPKTLYSDVAKDLLRDLGVDLARFETAFERGLYSSLGLSRGVFFARAAFGRDVLVAGDQLTTRPADLAGPAQRPGDAFLAALPHRRRQGAASGAL
jgi:spermidine dehydrogenase